MLDRVSLFSLSFFLFLLQSLVFSFSLSLCLTITPSYLPPQFIISTPFTSPTSRLPCLSPFSLFPVFLTSLRGLVLLPIPLVRHYFTHPTFIFPRPNHGFNFYHYPLLSPSLPIVFDKLSNLFFLFRIIDLIEWRSYEDMDVL
jgi:hypothetical protein